MSSSILHVLLIILVIFTASACRFEPQPENTNVVPFVAGEIKTGIPFSTREPDVFQAEIIITANAGSEITKKKYFVARNGERRLTVFNRGEKGEKTILQTDKVFVIDGAKKNFREISGKTASFADDNLKSFLTTEWLAEKKEASFENLGAENNLTKFRVRLNDSTNSEILIFVDENLKMPVRQEFYSVSGEQKTLMFSVELENYQTRAEESLFVIPEDFKKIE